MTANCHEIPLISCIKETFLSNFKNSKSKLKESLDIFWNDEVVKGDTITLIDNCRKIGENYSMPNVHWITIQFSSKDCASRLNNQ